MTPDEQIAEALAKLQETFDDYEAFAIAEREMFRRLVSTVMVIGQTAVGRRTVTAYVKAHPDHTVSAYVQPLGANPFVIVCVGTIQAGVPVRAARDECAQSALYAGASR